MFQTRQFFSSTGQVHTLFPKYFRCSGFPSPSGEFLQGIGD
jgi:hypothetical protein